MTRIFIALALASSLFALSACAAQTDNTATSRLGERTAYYVDGNNLAASDTNPGTAQKPWKTIARAGSAKELKPGDAVLIESGVYREHADISVSGEPGRPILFAAAPDARVVLKGSEIIRGSGRACPPPRT